MVLHGALWTDGRICRWGATTSPAKMWKGCCDDRSGGGGGTSNDNLWDRKRRERENGGGTVAGDVEERGDRLNCENPWPRPYGMPLVSPNSLGSF